MDQTFAKCTDYVIITLLCCQSKVKANNQVDMIVIIVFRIAMIVVRIAMIVDSIVMIVDRILMIVDSRVIIFDRIVMIFEDSNDIS